MTILRASLHTLGCRLNQAESALLEDKLAEAGYMLVPFGEPADLGIIHTCTVTREADAKSRKYIRQFIRKNPCAFTVVIGCYAQTDLDTLMQIDGIDLIIGNQEKLELLDYVGLVKNAKPRVVRDRIRRDDFTIDLPDAPERCNGITRRANLKIQDGCDFMCSFCIIPFARGRVRARAMDNLLEEARSLAVRGAKELVITGINVGTYRYRGQTIVDVIERLNTIKGLRRIRISSIEPTTIPEALFPLMRDPDHALAPFLHIPLQSGSNRILEAMRRQYTREEYLAFVRLARECVPDIGIGADVMVGFPGETDTDFRATYDLVRESPLFYAHVFVYSERPGTASVRMPGKVDAQTVQNRSARLRRLSAAKKRDFGRTYVGRSLEVLFEQQENGVWTGYTGNYLRVAVRSREDVRNEIRAVELKRTGRDIVHGTLAHREDG